jgi:hypothetical protein
MMRFFCLFLFFGAAPTLAYDASDCNVNPLEKTQNNREMQQLFPTSRDQDGIGWCYAYAAADLMSFKLGKPVSAVHLSHIYNNDLSIIDMMSRDLFMGRNNNLYEGGFAKAAIEAGAERSMCTEKGLSSRINYSDLRGMGAIGSLVERLQQNNNQRERDNNAYYSDDTIKCSDVNEETKRVLSRLSCNEITGFINANYYKGKEAVIEKLIAANCQGEANSLNTGKLRARSLSSDWYSDRESMNRLIEGLNRQLDQKNIVSFSYNTRKLSTFDVGGWHESVIIGRKWDSVRNECMYVVRNSWGPGGCGGSINDRNYVECPYQANPPGSYLINEAGLRRAARAITYIE